MRKVLVPVVLLLLVAGAPACGTKPSARAATERNARLAAARNADASGVTATEVRVGFVDLQTEALQSTLGITLAPSGDIPAQIEALADEVNRTGGIAGRKMVPVVRPFEALTDSQITEEKLCKSFTQDDRVFAVVLQGQFGATVRSCYRDAETLMLDTTAFPLDQEAFESYAPYLWQPSYPEYGELTAAMVTSLGSGGFFRRHRLGILGVDNTQNRRVYQQRISVALEAEGVKPADVRWIDGSSSSTLQSGLDQAVLAFKAAGVDRLLTVGGSRLASFMMSTAQKQQWYPGFALSTWDSPDFGIRNYPDSMRAAQGVSLIAGYDVDEADAPFPSTPAERTCVDVLERSGERFEKRVNVRQQLMFCDAAFLLRDAFAGSSGPVDAASFATGIARLGREFRSAASWASGFGPDRYTGSTGFRPMRYVASCNCMRLDGDVTTFESP